MRSLFIVEVKHAKPLSELDKVIENRLSTLDGVSGVGTVTALPISKAAGWAALQHDRGMK